MRNFPHEIHITVNFKNKSIVLFKKDCLELKVKPILLDLQLKNSQETMKDLMTSSVVVANNIENVFNEATNLSKALESRGYEVVRTKIEVPPWHFLTPTKINKIKLNSKNNYFESHLNVLCTGETKNLLNDISKKYNAHLSKNAFKVYENNFTIMITLRDKINVYEIFKEKLDKLKEEILLNNFSLEKEIIEFCIYDSNLNHDLVWTQ